MLLQLALSTRTFGTVPLAFTTFFDLVLKILFIVGAMLYLVFAFVVVRQIQVMKNTVLTPFSGVVQVLGFVHLLFAFGVLMLFIMIL